MEFEYVVLYVLIGLIVVAALGFIIYLIFKSPFKYPYYKTVFDISGKRSPNIYDLIDEHLNKNGFDNFLNHYENVESWKKLCNERIKKSKLKKLRQKQFQAAVDDIHMFLFVLVRMQTRYKQVNYVKSPYKVFVTTAQYSFGFDVLKQRFDALANIEFECTLSEYHSKEQRKLMTKALRNEIVLRDNYTCQICGKYMPDGVGLHIDHIVPIVKGGKSVSSNLQVLCSKCNGKKSKK